MFDVKVNEEQRDYAGMMVSKFNFGKRGYADGNKEQQFVGVLGQVVIADLTDGQRPNGENGFDGGVDLIIKNKKIDIKTMTRTVPMKPHFVHNFIGYQLRYGVDYYLFCSFNKSRNILTVCGLIKKEDFLKKSSYYPKGSKRYRDDNSFFVTNAPLYEIRQSDLNDVNTLNDVYMYIK
ncbi:hypothetical protein ACPF7I_08350 [Anoxybacillus sp. D401a]|uniref:hypothetical protein n=1 Tax=Anoxybacillus sp. D401a TaxID=575112 RepID=UPI003D339C51